MPQKSTKHIASPPLPIGSIKDGRIKVLDGDTQKASWRQVKTGIMRDYDGEPTSKRYNAKDMKKKPTHHVRTGSSRSKHKPHMG